MAVTIYVKIGTHPQWVMVANKLPTTPGQIIKLREKRKLFDGTWNERAEGGPYVWKHVRLREIRDAHGYNLYCFDN